MQIKKRDGNLVAYDGSKIINVIVKSMKEGDTGVDTEIAEKIESDIYETLKKQNQIFTVEQVSDLIESKLMENGRYNTAKRFILYRERQKDERKKGWNMSELQRDIFKQKYEFENEGFEGFLNRIAKGNDTIKKLMRQKKFIPAGRILANRGLQEKGAKVTLSNCYVLEPPEDNIESIFETAGKLARTFSFGGGCGLDIGKLRPNGAKVNNSAKYTTGSVSFMELYSMVTGLIGQNSRRGALMLSILCSHPDIEEFMDIKLNLDKVTSANISIRFTDDFMKAVENKSKYICEFLIEDTDELITKEVDAYALFMKLCVNNWNMAEPGALFWTEIENYNILSEDDEFEYVGVNPCAEEPLPAGGSCLLSSINLSEFIINPFTDNAIVDYDSLQKCMSEVVIYMNEILDEGIELHPLMEQQISAREYRQIGVGYMGIADMLIKLGLKYGSKESIDLCDKIGFLLADSAIKQSALLSKEQGSYPKYKKEAILSSDFILNNTTIETRQLIEQYGLRNSQILTIAPTGSISTLFGISGGIEPIFMLSYTRKTETLNDGKDTFYKVFTPIVQEYLNNNEDLTLETLPDFFVTSMELDYMDRIAMQSAWQKHIDASISSTVNLKKEATVEDVYNIYMGAWKSKLKGITVYRDGCKRAGILSKTESDDSPKSNNFTMKQLEEMLIAKFEQADKGLLENPDDCPFCKGIKMIPQNGCKTCPNCGYSPCS